MQIFVLTAPSGAGKSSIARKVQAEMPALKFSVSATTRPPREGEENGVHYYFLSEAEFRDKVQESAFVEYEEVYPNQFYGTLVKEIDRITGNSAALLDIDVRGALKVKKRYGENAFVIFIRPPSYSVLAERLQRRGTENLSSLKTRLKRAEEEMRYADSFDAVVLNDDLDQASGEVIALIKGKMKQA